MEKNKSLGNEIFENKIKSIKKYAKKEYVPIIKVEALSFLLQELNLQIEKEQKQLDILEIGTAIGYSSIEMTNTFLKSGKNIGFNIVTIERDINRYNLAKKNILDFGYDKYITQIQCDAEIKIKSKEFEKELIKNNKKFNLIFIDANKSKYEMYYDFAKQFIKKDGVIICDNVLFNGYVLGEYTEKKHRSIVNNLRRFLDKIKQNEQNYQIIEKADGILVIK